MCWSPTAPRYEEIAIANSGNTKTDAAIDIDGGIGTLKYYARLGAEPRRGAHVARREAGAARQGRELSGHPPDGAAPRRRHPHQRVQFPELGPVGEGGGVAAGRRAGARQAGVLDRAAGARDGEGRDRGQGAAGRGAEPALRRRRRSARMRSPPTTWSPSPARPTRRRACAATPTWWRRSVPVNIEADSINAALLAPDAAAGQRRLRCLRARSGARDDGEGRAEMHRDPPHLRAGRQGRCRRRGACGQAQGHQGRRSAPARTPAWGRW